MVSPVSFSFDTIFVEIPHFQYSDFKINFGGHNYKISRIWFFLLFCKNSTKLKGNIFCWWTFFQTHHIYENIYIIHRIILEYFTSNYQIWHSSTVLPRETGFFGCNSVMSGWYFEDRYFFQGNRYSSVPWILFMSSISY